MKGRGPLVPSVPLCSAGSRLLGSVFYNEGWWGKKKHRQNNLCDYELIDINLLGITPSHSTTELRVENTFPEKLFFSCAFCGEGETIIEKKKGKDRRWKGQPRTITASSAPALLLNCTNHSLSLAPHWRGLSGSSGRDVSRNTIQKPTEPAQVHLESWAVLSTLRRSRDTPDPTLARRGKTSTHSQQWGNI